MAQLLELPSLSQRRHYKIHHPFINDRIIEPIPYLTLPFGKEDFSKSTYSITEGWRYSRQEQKIHGYAIHGGIDYQAPYGTVIVAPCDGYAISSYFSFPIKNGDSVKRIDGKQVYFGLGYFVQIYNPEVNRFVVLAHLSEVDPSIPFSLPTFKDNIWAPTSHNLKINELTDHPYVVQIKRGDVIGKLGYSGLRWGYEEYIEGSSRPVVIDETKCISFDEPHVHFEEYWRDQKTEVKGYQRDPYDIYLTARNYPTPKHKALIGREPLFILGSDGLPIFAR